MSSYILKSKGCDITNTKKEQISVGRFYSGDRFYTLLNEYIDKNLSRQSVFMAWIIKFLFKSSNYKHDPGIANGRSWSVKLFDWFCVACFIAFIILSLGVISTLVPLIVEIVKGKPNNDTFEKLWKALAGVGVPAIVLGIPGISWLVIYCVIRKKNKPLSLQAFVEKKVSFCLKLRFLIKNVKNVTKEKDPKVLLLENFEAQGASGPRWLNIQLINLVCSIFEDFNYMFRFESLSDEDMAELAEVINYDFKQVELIKADDLKWNKYIEPEKKNIWEFSKKTKKNSKKTKTVVEANSVTTQPETVSSDSETPTA